MTEPIRILSVMEASSMTGVAKALLAFYTVAREQGWATVRFLTFVRTDGNGNAPSNAFIEAIRGLGFPITVIPERSAFDPTAIRSLRRLLREQPADVVETHAVKAHVLLRLLRPPAVSWVAFHHGYTDQDFKMRLYNRLNPWALRGADAAVTVCQPFAAQLAASGVPRARISVVPNAIEVTPQSVEEAAKPAGKTVLSIGRLSAEKGHRFLLSAMAELRKRRPELPVRLLLVGDGPERARLEAQAGELGIRDAVQFAGQQADPMPYYRGADVFVLPSLSEGSPLVLLEAMSMETPIVGTAVGGIPETVPHAECALLVPPQDATELADAIERLLTDGALAQRLAAAAYGRLLRQHTPQRYAQTLLSLYRGLLNGSLTGPR